jgi:hypothetical protein
MARLAKGAALKFWQLTRWRLAGAKLNNGKTILEYYAEVLAEQLKVSRPASIHERDHHGLKQIAVFVELDDQLAESMQRLEHPENYFDIKNPLGKDNA